MRASAWTSAGSASKHFQKRFVLAVRMMPEAMALEPMTREAFGRWHLRQSLRAMGAASLSLFANYIIDRDVLFKEVF